VGRTGEAGAGEFHLPHSLWVDRHGRVYVCDRENSRIQVFTATGDYLTHWTDIHRPTDIYINAQSVSYVSEARPSVSILDESGNKLARWDSPPGHGLWVDSRGDIYLASVGAKSITKYVHKS
jgi:DNA-binding beta-propeller fold protein YncE